MILPVLGFTFIFIAFSVLTHTILNIPLPDAVVYLNIVVPVLAGYFFGPRTGVLVGGLGPLIIWKIPYIGFVVMKLKEPAGMSVIIFIIFILIIMEFFEERKKKAVSSKSI